MVSKTAVYCSYEIVGKIVACVSNAKAFLDDTWAVRIAQKILQFYVQAANATIFLKLGGFFLFRKWNVQQKKLE